MMMGIYQKGLNTIFVQGRFARQGKYSTSNIGVGYRYLLSNHTWIFGANTFYDHEWRYRHQRIGFGLEAISQYAAFRANYYDAISKERNVLTVNGISTYEKALNGYDASAAFPLPYLPWLRVEYRRYFWWRYNVSNIKGNSIGVHANPTGNLEMKVGMSDENASKKSYFVYLDWHFNQPDRIEYTLTQTPHNSGLTKYDLSRHTLDYVQRENDIIVETTQRNSGGIIIARGT